MNITASTFIFTLLQAILGVTAATVQTRYPDVAFWSSYGVAVSGAILITMKQFFPKP